jgi:hypothetical protein
MKNAVEMTRRKAAAALISFPALASTALAQTAPPADPLQAAKDRIKANGDILAKEEVPMSTEPAFQFKA